MTVYAILRQNNHDYSEAEKYGKIKFLFPLGVNVMNTSLVVSSAYEWFKDFDFDNDHFLPLGNPIIVALVSMCLSEAMFPVHQTEVSILEWDKHAQTYVPRVIDFQIDSDVEV